MRNYYLTRKVGNTNPDQNTTKGGVDCYANWSQTGLTALAEARKLAEVGGVDVFTMLSAFGIGSKDGGCPFTESEFMTAWIAFKMAKGTQNSAPPDTNSFVGGSSDDGFMIGAAGAGAGSKQKPNYNYIPEEFNFDNLTKEIIANPLNLLSKGIAKL